MIDRPPHDVADFRCVDITDGPALKQALQDTDVVIHLAGNLVEGEPRDILLGPSFLGVWNLHEAAATCGVERLIVASTNQVVDNPPGQDRLVGPDVAFLPGSIYAVSKINMEMLGRLYAKQHRLSVLIVRIGWMPGSRDDMQIIGKTLRCRNMYLSFDDAARFFACAVESDGLPRPGVEVVYAVSRGEKHDGGLDREPARRLLGYEGQDVWPDGYPQLTEAP